MTAATTTTATTTRGRQWTMVSTTRLLIASTGVMMFGVMLSSILESMEDTRHHTAATVVHFRSGVDGPSWDASQESMSNLLPQSSMFTVRRKEWLVDSSASAAKKHHPKHNDRSANAGRTAAATTPIIKVYIYENLPPRYTDDLVECIMDLAQVRDTDTFSPLTTKMADIAILRLFETYPHRTNDPNQADIYVVPYPHTAHCYCADGWQRACGQVTDSEIDHVFSYLTYRNETTAARHLFVLSGNQFFINGRLMEQPFKLLGGNLSPDEVHRRDHGTIVIPYLNDKALFQNVFVRPDDWWTTRPRQYAFAFVFGEANQRNMGHDPRRVRLIFRDNWVKRNKTELGGLPVYVRSFNNSAAMPKDAVWKGFAAYHDSVFCPILAGDSCQQARFFDAMMAGCIPVVLNFTDTDVSKKRPDSWAAQSLTSWYKKHGETTAAVYPFNNVLVPDFGIDYDACVVAVTATSFLDAMKLPGVMDQLLRHEPDRILTIRRHLRDCAVRTAFAMGGNAHRGHDDAFAQILRMIDHHLQQLRAKAR